MLKKIDDLLINLAKCIITVASFFDIGRYKLMKWWIIVTSITCFAIDPQINYPASFLFSLICGLVFSHLVMLPLANNAYREDDVLDNNPLLTWRWFRIVYLVIMSLVAYDFYIVKYFNSDYWLMVIIKLPSPAFFPYFILNQNTKSKVTLKSFVKGLGQKLEEITAPKPISQPVPVRN